MFSFFKSKKQEEVVPHTEFEAELSFLTEEQGGRKTPFFMGYEPEFQIGLTNTTGKIFPIGGTSMVMPGETINCKVELRLIFDIKEQEKITIRDKGKVIGTGVVLKII